MQPAARAESTKLTRNVADGVVKRISTLIWLAGAGRCVPRALQPRVPLLRRRKEKQRQEAGGETLNLTRVFF